MITFKGLPKISLNEWYSGAHWSERKKIKDAYKWIIRSQVKEKFTESCEVEYIFTFKSRPLDCSNCVAMAKMIEDCLFPKDDIKVVKSMKLTSKKGKEDKVTINILACTNQEMEM
jgi:hypothetical protein